MSYFYPANSWDANDEDVVDSGDASAPLSVSELSARLKQVVEPQFTHVCVCGEISSVSQPRSGHAYFTLKDQSAQLPAVAWRSTVSKLRFELKNGADVVCYGRIEVYAPHGKYQLIISKIEPVGIGALQLAFNQLQEKLQREGLFDPGRKKPWPTFVRRVGVVTSLTGAAVRDFLNILGRRSPFVDVIVAPVRVQGAGSAQEIAHAIVYLNAKRFELNLDAIVLIRGGGSMEDLWSFNEEIVARAISASTLPVATGVGHEIDVTISDLVADLRTLTPSDAAGRIAPDAGVLRRELEQWQKRMDAKLQARLQLYNARLDNITTRPLFHDPARVIYQAHKAPLEALEKRLQRSVKAKLDACEQRFMNRAMQLEALSPLSVLSRGYTITRRHSDGQPVCLAESVREGETLETQFHDGVALSVVVERRVTSRED
ncbi:MAG: exodeoxyribonuclease VII large subunit [Planctomycetia bacterium]|nr:exodeoxyribonuclease VII large subunit [Planctomycetia bacterium]